MAEVLVHLNEVVKSVSSRLMPTELDDVAGFLLGQHVQAVMLDDAKKAPRNSEKGKAVSVGVDAKPAPEVRSFLAPPPLRQIKIPDGLTAWHDFVPLGIATDNVVWGNSGDGGAVLHTFFSGRGFDKVLSVNFIPANSTALAGSSTVLDNGETQAEGGSASLRSIRESRFTCVEDIREWCKMVEAEARQGQGVEFAAGRSTAQLTFSNSKPKRTREVAEHQNTVGSVCGTSSGKPIVRRLLVIVRCCTDNRAMFSTSGGGKAQHRTRRRVNGNDSVEAARRHRYGSDELLLFLHDFAALGTFYNLRLMRRCWRVHLAFLLLPEDQLYGGTLLERRLEEEVGHHYHIKLFTQHDDYDADENEGHGGSASSHKPSTPSATRMRVQRLVSLWEPSLLHCPTFADGMEAPATMNSSSNSVVSRIEDLEGKLLRGKGFYFLRPHNLPLCCFLCEALRRFPLLVQSSVLRQWQKVWAVRHSLQDIVLSFHGTLMPFALSCHWLSATNDNLTSEGHEEENNNQAIPVAPASESHGEIRGRRRAAYVDILKDATDLIDGLLSASDALAHGCRLDTAVFFMLLYAELIDPSSSGLHVLRCQPIVEALEMIYDREERACCLLIESAKKVPSDGTPLADIKQKARYALKHYLPFSCSSRGYPDAALERLPNLGIPLTSTLKNCLIDSILSPEASMRELLRAAAYQDGSLAALRAPGPSPQRECVPNVAWTLSANNFYHTRIPDSIRVLYLLTAHAQYYEVEKAKHVRIVNLQQIAQLSDEAVMLALKELELAGLVLINTQSQTACSLLQ